MEFNSSLSTSVTDFISYFKGSSNNITSGLKEGLFDDILDKSFCDNDESEDIDYNLILNLLNNIELPNINNNIIKSYDLESSYTNINEISSNIEINDNKVEQDLQSSEETELLKKLDNIISENKIEKTDELFKINKSNNMNLKVNENIIYQKVNEATSNIEVNKISSNEEINDYKVEEDLLSGEDVEILNKLKKKFQVKSEIQSNNIEKIELSNEEIELLKKLNNMNLKVDENIIYPNVNKATSNIEVNKISSSEEINDYKAEQDLLSIEDVEIFNVLKNKFQVKSEIPSNNTEKIELSKEEVELLRKLDNAIPTNVDKSNLVANEKFIQLENSNTINKLNLIRNDNLQKTDKELDTLESIVSLDDNNLIISSNQLINRDINPINNTPIEDVPTIRQDYIGEDIIKTVKYLKSSDNEVITVKMSPKELGDMTIKLINDKDESSVVITISKSDVFDLVNDNQNEIVKHLKELNINIKEISIEMKNNTENNFSSNLSQEFSRNNQDSKRENRKSINLNDEEVDDVEEFYAEENINILV